MKTQNSTIGRQTKLILAISATLAGLGMTAQAQSLGIYYNLQTYGTVANGNSILDALGNTTATRE